jgi:hypothetical protein
MNLQFLDQYARVSPRGGYAVPSLPVSPTMSVRVYQATPTGSGVTPTFVRAGRAPAASVQRVVQLLANSGDRQSRCDGRTCNLFVFQSMLGQVFSLLGWSVAVRPTMLLGQFLGQRCLPHQAKNPETGNCYNVCAEGQKYDPSTGCVSLNWYKEHQTFLIVAGALAAVGWWRYLR